MKRILCILIALTLVFGAISPVFAITETVDQGANTKLQNIYDKLTAFTAFFTSWWAHDGSLDSTIQEGSFQMLAINVAKLTQWFEDWIIPRNITSTTSYLGLWDYVWYIAERVNDYWPTWDSYLGAVPSIASYVSSWMTSNNSYLSSLVDSLTNKKYTTNTANSWSFADTAKYASYYLLGGSPYVGDNVYSGEYKTPVYNNGAKSNRTYNWTFSSPIGNVALLVNTVADTLANGFTDVLSGFNANLSTWNHENNTQVAFTPTSFANGLYRYLAYIQSDTSALWYYGLNNYNKPIIRMVDDYIQKSETYTSLADMLNESIEWDFNSLHSLYRTVYIGRFNRWNNDLTQSSVSYRSTDDLIIKLFNPIAESIKKLAFVHADDNDIAAKRGTQANEQTITNNFLSTSGSAAASASDYGALASASGSFKQNFNTGASASGIFDLFNGDHASSWFSQETANQLDSNNAVRSIKGGVRTVTVSEYDTPLLDSYYSNIMSIFNKKTDDYNEYVNYIDESIYPAQGVQEEGVILD